MTTPSALHSKQTPCWGSPQDTINRARLCLGRIDVDPASSAEFNQLVGALDYFTQDDNGLSLPWRSRHVSRSRFLEPISESEALACSQASRVFVNPPGGLVKEFWHKLLDEVAAGNVDQAIWVGFSVEQLCQLADPGQIHPLDFSTCVLRKRLSFTRADGFKGSPSHGNYVTAIGVPREKFEQHFSKLGKITHGSLAT